MSKEVLSVKNLNMHYETLSRDVHAVKDVSFSVKGISILIRYLANRNIWKISSTALSRKLYQTLTLCAS